MRGCLFTLVLGAALLALLVTVGLPAIAAGVMTGAVTAAGLQSDDTTLTVSTDPPTELLGFHADRVRVRATDASFRGLQIGALDVTLGDVDILGRTAGTVEGQLANVIVPDVGGRTLAVGAIRLAGGGDAITAATTIPAGAIRILIADAIEGSLGIRPTSIALEPPDRLSVKAGITVHGQFVVTASGDLAVTVVDGPAGGTRITLLRGGEDLPIRFTSATVTPGGDLRLAGELSVGLLG